MQVNTVNVELSIARSHYVGYMHVTIYKTVPKFKLFDLEKFNTKLMDFTYCNNNVFVYFNLQLTLTGVGETGPQPNI
jgi:hypothetical protein